MGTIEKGVILSVEGNKARVQAADASGTSTKQIVIHTSIRGARGRLQKGTEVVYALFNDSSGLILARADGEEFNETE